MSFCDTARIQHRPTQSGVKLLLFASRGETRTSPGAFDSEQHNTIRDQIQYHIFNGSDINQNKYNIGFDFDPRVK